MAIKVFCEGYKMTFKVRENVAGVPSMRLGIVSLAIIVCLGFIAGCGSSPKPVEPNPDPSVKPKTEGKPEASAESKPTEKARDATDPKFVEVQEKLKGVWNRIAPEDWAGGLIAFDGLDKVTDKGLATDDGRVLFQPRYREGKVKYIIDGMIEVPIIRVIDTTNLKSSSADEERLQIVSIDKTRMVLLQTNALSGKKEEVEYKKVSEDPRHLYPKATALEPEAPAKTQPDETGPSPQEKLRTWTSAVGSKIEAELIKVADGKATLRKADGKEVTVPIDKLSKEDQEYIKESPLGKVAEEVNKPGEVRSYQGLKWSANCIAISTDGRMVAAGTGGDGGRPYPDCDAIIWDVESGNEVSRLNGHANHVSSIRFLVDGKRVLTGDEDGMIRLWDIGSKQELKKFSGHAEGIRSIAVAKDDSIAVSGSASEIGQFVAGKDRSVRVWDIRTGVELHRFEGHEKGVTGVALSSDASRVVSCSYDGTVRIWDVAGKKEIKKIDGDKVYLQCVALSPDDRLIAAGDVFGRVRVWSAETGEVVRELKGHRSQINSLAFSSDGTRILTGSGAKDWIDTDTAKMSASDASFRLWDTASGKQLFKFPGTFTLMNLVSVNGVLFGRDGRIAFFGSSDRTVRHFRLPK